MKKLALLSILSILILGGCRQNSKSAKTEAHDFPKVQVPAAIIDSEGRVEYVLDHYWDAYAQASSGVSDESLCQAIADYLFLLESVSKDRAQKSMEKSYARVEASSADSAAYSAFASNMASYLDDPNSPYRDEDLYLSYLKGVIASPRTSIEELPARLKEFERCSINKYGDQAPDFLAEDMYGKVFNLYGVKADYTMLFFSNPGCSACKQIIDDVMSAPYTEGFLADGTLAVVNIYIDEEIDEWRDYAPAYPASWHSGFDPAGVIRSDKLYVVRAIPSLYLLDSQKRVIMKDAPTDKVMQYLSVIAYGN